MKRNLLCLLFALCAGPAFAQISEDDKQANPYHALPDNENQENRVSGSLKPIQTRITP